MKTTLFALGFVLWRWVGEKVAATRACLPGGWLARQVVSSNSSRLTGREPLNHPGDCIPP
ncbi:hypothetical protein [Gloeomargarita sp.]